MNSPKKKRYFPTSLNQTTAKQDGDRPELINIIPSSENLMDQQFQRELQDRFAEIINSPTLQKIHPKKRPNCNVSAFLQLKLLGKTYREMGEILNITPSYAGSYWERKCEGILQQQLADLREYM